MREIVNGMGRYVYEVVWKMVMGRRSTSVLFRRKRVMDENEDWWV